MKHHRIALGTALAAVSLALVPSGANAAFDSVKDKAGDIDPGVDLRRATLTYDQGVTVVLEHRNLRSSFKSGSGGQIFLDTDAEQKGPEFVLSAGLFKGTDYTLNRADGWKPTGEPLSCKHNLTLDFAAETTVATFGKKCLGKPEEIRMAVKVGAKKQTDWLTGKRVFTDWVAQG